MNIQITQDAIKYVAESAEIEIEDAQEILMGAISLCKFPSDAEQRNAPVQTELNGAVFCRPQFHVFIEGVCAHCGYDERPVQTCSVGG